MNRRIRKKILSEGKCSAVVTIDELLKTYREVFAMTDVEKGERFERLMRNFLLTYPVWRGKISDVWRWKDFPYRDELGGKDLGIDLVVKTVDGDFWAAQCKFYSESTAITKSAVDSFIANSARTFNGGKKFSRRLWISTSDNFTDNAREMLKNQSPAVEIINLETLRRAQVNWALLDNGFTKDDAIIIRKLRDYQLDAVNKTHEYFKRHERGKLIMACGTGKTFTALKIAERETDSQGLILVLVPSIMLIKQTLVEWAQNADKPFNAVCVCSDATAADKNSDEIRNVTLPIPPTTDSDLIKSQIAAHNAETMTVVFSTYQSLDKVAAAQIEFDLIICDEAHRTTGSSKDLATQFTAVHNNNFIRGRKRLYMTATPRMFTSDAKTKAAVNDITLWSMDDATIFGKEIYRLDFGDAVTKNLLSDYKVIVFTVNEKPDNDKLADDTAKINGTINALSKKMVGVSQCLADVDPAPMHTAVTFCPTIKDSKIIAETFNAIAETKRELLDIHVEHVDGTQDSHIREQKLSTLKNVPTEHNACNILTNVRCLSEGVDVPALDAVIFMSSKKSKVEIVQAVGRVMRKAPNKKYGYIIIPVVVPLEKNPEDVLDNSDKFKVIWEVLNALRAHDKRIDIYIEQIKLQRKRGDNHYDGHIIIGGVDNTEEDTPFQIPLNFGEWQDFLYARMVERVGNRRYWEQWAKDIADIADRHIQRINDLISVPGNPQREFGNFVYNLRENLNPSITPAQAIEMLAQHIVSRPVFDALFEDYSFVKNNPVSQSLEKILAVLDTKDTAEDSEQLQKFFDSVRERCAIAKTAEEKQAIIIDLYDKFFKIAAPKTVEKLGIVYTPVEVVDFILRSVDDVLKKNFNRSLSDKNVHVLDAFAGTGTFLVRLIQSGLIKPRDLLRKYRSELHANELVLLAYYIAAINVENTFHDAAQIDDYQPFEGICFTDTFQAAEQDDNAKGQSDFKQMRDPIEINSARINEQLQTRIEIIVGNPPYSVGQKSANDNNQNQFYGKLEARISSTYAAKTNATNKNSLYDSYIKAFRWASDRISAGGVIGFVTNAGWLDGAAMDGLRKCFAEEFSAIYVFNLRGNQRTQGETSRREGGKIFGSGSRAPIAITILVKNPAHVGKADIFYRDIGDYLTREQKLAAVKILGSVLSDEFKPLTPNDKGDWLNQRGNEFETFIPLHEIQNSLYRIFFMTRSMGAQTARDAFSYNFSRSELEKNIRTTIDFYNSHEPTEIDSKKFVWTSSAVQNKNRGRKYKFNAAQIVESIYRPFCKQYLYIGEGLMHRRRLIDEFFPSDAKNLLICVSGIGGEKEFTTIITNKITDLNILHSTTQCYPLYHYEEERGGMDDMFNPGKKLYKRLDGVSDWILRRAIELCGAKVSKEDIFYYVYGFLHLSSYREKFSAELKKSLPRIILVNDVEKFWRLSRAGRELAAIHLNYESQPPAQVEVIGGGNYRVEKMRLSKDKTALTYNSHITIKNIPPRAFEYVVNGRSPLEWVIERYQVKTDKASGIINNPNDWASEHDNPRYILDLVLSSITVSLKTLDIVESLPEVDF